MYVECLRLQECLRVSGFEDVGIKRSGCGPAGFLWMQRRSHLIGLETGDGAPGIGGRKLHIAACSDWSCGIMC